jgi:hypothetical protein
MLELFDALLDAKGVEFYDLVEIADTQHNLSAILFILTKTIDYIYYAYIIRTASVLANTVEMGERGSILIEDMETD